MAELRVKGKGEEKETTCNSDQYLGLHQFWHRSLHTFSQIIHMASINITMLAHGRACQQHIIVVL